jgi:hypothetical protein
MSDQYLITRDEPTNTDYYGALAEASRAASDGYTRHVYVRVATVVPQTTITVTKYQPVGFRPLKAEHEPIPSLVAAEATYTTPQPGS